MVSDIISKLQDTSYTNKDFESIYPELLDLVKALTYKWDPSISNESDPGVILIKLNALIADKCNYNSDKNVLECFPLSVTQDYNARLLFSLLGYYMHWYKSAYTDVSLRWKGNKSQVTYNIPPFTMVCNADKSVIYSLIGPSNGSKNESFIVSDLNLYADNSSTCVFKAIQGLAVNYSINGDTLITVDYLDENNRLYFDTTDIALNGIFITNANSKNYSSWVRKDNLEVESLNNTYYKFGVSDDGTSCYIEFPKDVESLFKNGINITYIRTLGVDGNISATLLDRFYNDILVSDGQGGTYTLSSDNVYITNVSSAVNGLDVEDIDHAYAGYLKTIGTFNTLVTLRDYINYIYNSKLVSNDFVCDRGNDIQSCYNIMSSVDGLDSESLLVDTTAGKPDLTAFSLKLYLLQYVEDVSLYSDFAKTFDLITNHSEISTIKSYIEDIKCILHDYVDIKSKSSTRSNFCYFKNRYPISCTIIPKYELTTDEILTVKNNIKHALLFLLQARNLDFGEAINFSEVYDCILKSDQCIKQVSLDNINYDIYGVYCDDDGKLYEVNLDDDKSFDYDIDSVNDLVVSVNRATFLHKVGSNYLPVTFTYNGNDTWSPDIEEYGVDVTGELTSADKVTVIPTPVLQFRDEIYVKSVLAGRTLLFVSDEEFLYDLSLYETSYQADSDLTYPSVIDDIILMSTNVNITLTPEHNEYLLRKNETILFWAPNLLEGTTYSNGVKYQCKLLPAVGESTKIIPANTSYKLKAGEFIIVYWKDVNSPSSLYLYYTYGLGNIITPTFTMSYDSSYTPIGDPEVTSNLLNVGTTSNPIMLRWTTDDTPMSTSLFKQVSALNDPYILSGSAKITNKTSSTLLLDNSYTFYWILNSLRDGKYVLFEQGTDNTERMLNVGEYVFYTNSQFSDLVILGAGTTISITDTSVEYSVLAKDSTVIFEDGLSYLSPYLFSLNPQASITITENLYINVPPTGSIRFNNLLESLIIDHEGLSPDELNDIDILYRNSPTSDWSYLSAIVLDAGSGWSCKSMLGLNISPENELPLLQGLTVTYVKSDSTTASIDGADLADNLYPVVLKSKSSLIFNGAEEIDVKYYEDDVLNNNKLYVYGKHISTSDTDFTNNGDVIIKFEGNSTQLLTKTILFNIPVGEYILTLDNNYQSTTLNSTSLKLKADSESVASEVPYIYGVTPLSESFNEKGTKHYKLNIQNSESYSLIISCKNTSKDDVFLNLRRVYKYTMPDRFKKLYKDDALTMFEHAQFLLNTFDPHHKYDYSYQVPSNTMIEEPLEGISFLQPNHIYNKFTICLMERINDSLIKVVGS